METELTGPGWKCAWPLCCELGEGPVWVERDQALWFVDIERPAVHRFDPATGKHASFTPPWRVGSIAPRVAGGFIAGTEAGLALVDPVAGRWDIFAEPETHLPANRFNDGKVDPAGRFWAGTMDDTKRHKQGSLYRVDADLRWTAEDCDYGITNGPAFSPDGRVMYHSDTRSRTTYAFDVAADGNIAGKRVFAQWPRDFGSPDGMTVDAGGDLWVAFWGGCCVRRVSPAGAVLAKFDLPVSNVTSMAFAGPGLDRLFVTTARQALDCDALEAQPLAGGLFELDADGARGCPPVEFAG
ncbi:SMP-30/gluconolactonase/LRE family protein [Sphingosinicellaceae bacterium]|nr:SMP-30/gluconolactonase/LRE family protein [Sphingosinicellaceae bacterium]